VVAVSLSTLFGIETRREHEIATPGHSYPRRVYAEGGKGGPIVKKLRAYAEAIGVEFIDSFQAIDLIRDAARVGGAVFIGKDDVLTVFAGSTVLATGGIGGLYHNSDNPRDVTGEGLGIAWRHGAELENMEFIQFYPYRLIHPVNTDVYTKIFGKGAVMRNRDGIRFMEPFARKELETRDVLSYEMFKQGTVLLDVSQVPPDVIEQTSPNVYRLLQKGYHGDLIMSPVEHYSLGGLCIDEYGRTTVPGLFACGECTSIHGANRLGGGSLTDCLVFGTRAGYMAAQEAKAPKQSEIAVTDLNPHAFHATWKSPSISETLKTLKQTMWQYVGIERTSEGLKYAVSLLDELRKPYRKAKNLSDLVMSDILNIAYLTAFAAAQRKESRGAHRLLDIPEQNDDWNGVLVFKGEECTFRKR
jgi:aspartate oxidase